MLPAHAQTSNVCTGLLRIEIQDSYNSSGNGTVLTTLDIQIANTECGCEDPHYIAAGVTAHLPHLHPSILIPMCSGPQTIIPLPISEQLQVYYLRITLLFLVWLQEQRL